MHAIFVTVYKLIHQQQLLLPINSLLSGITWVSRYQKGRTFWILVKQEMMGWQLHQQDHMQIICISLQTYSHRLLITQFFTGQMLFLTPSEQQQCQSTSCVTWYKIKQLLGWVNFIDAGELPSPAAAVSVMLILSLRTVCVTWWGTY